MSKIGGRAGHNEKCRGAKAILDEVIEDRKIFPWTKFYLEQKHNFIDCTPYHNPATQSEDLNFGIKKANDNSVDLFYSVHLNKSTEYFEGVIGAEIWVYDRNSTKAIEAAKRILSNLQQLGFKNRGIKYMKEENRQLGELMYTNCNALIIECFFLEATKDLETYNKVGPEEVGFAIASGIDPSIIRSQQSVSNKPTYYRIVTGGFNTLEKLSAAINNYFKHIIIEIKLDKNNNYYIETGDFESRNGANDFAAKFSKDGNYYEIKTVQY